jgi:hypothetical protein
MNIITLLWWSLGRGNPAVPSRWQATRSHTRRNSPPKRDRSTASRPAARADSSATPSFASPLLNTEWRLAP